MPFPTPVRVPITVQILHTSAVVNAGLRSILAEAQDIVVASEDGARGVDAVVITDSLDGLQQCRQVAARDGRHGPRILIVAQPGKEWEIRHALDAGAQGYVSQSCSPDELRSAVRELGAGRCYPWPAASRSAGAGFARDTLTGRETEVLQLLGQGHCNKIIAREMGIGVGTVKSHLQAILSKLNATARTHAVVLATQRGLISPGRPVLAHQRQA
jgi:DNA-binding NarL/FixJ family response regulator